MEATQPTACDGAVACSRRQVDIMLVPYTIRWDVMTHFHGFQLPDSDEYAEVKQWHRNMIQASLSVIRPGYRTSRRRSRRGSRDLGLTDIREGVRPQGCRKFQGEAPGPSDRPIIGTLSCNTCGASVRRGNAGWKSVLPFFFFFFLKFWKQYSVFQRHKLT